MRKPRSRIAIIAGACALAACSSGIEGTGQVTVLLTDAPADNIAIATVWVSNVRLVPGDSTGPSYTILNTQQEYDLLTLTDGVTAALGTATIPVGDYSQMRLVVDSARIVLKSGFTFSDGSSSRVLQTPSGQQSGIKVNFSGPVHVEPGQTILVVDFDVSRNFLFTGPSASPTGAIFKPVLHASVVDVAGSIAGTVSPASSRARLYAINGVDTVTSARADTVTGAYKLWFLPPGSYTVSASAVGFTTQSTTTTVADGQDVTGVNFTLVP